MFISLVRIKDLISSGCGCFLLPYRTIPLPTKKIDEMSGFLLPELEATLLEMFSDADFLVHFRPFMAHFCFFI